jgi:HAD superfamily hydrolase (TIGR01490 family)
VAFATSAWRSRPLAQALALRQDFMAEVMNDAIGGAARELVARHQAQGDLVAIVTATNEFVTEPIARAFGVDHLIALELERDAHGAITGAIRGTPTFRDGKITRVVQWLTQQGHPQGREAFSRITVYSDSINDLPLLEWATHPVATHPAPSLADIARQRQWPILELFR